MNVLTKITLQSHSTTISLFLPIFKTFNFSQNICLFQKKISNALRNSNNSVAFHDKFATFSKFWQFHIFLEKKDKLGTSWKNLNFPSHFTTTLLFYWLLKHSNIFLENPIFLKQKIKLWTFWKFLIIRSHFTANLQNLENFNKLNFFSENPYLFNKPRNLNILTSLTISVAFYDKFATITDF